MWPPAKGHRPGTQTGPFPAWAGHAIVGRLAVGQIGLTCMRWGVALVPILAAARPSLRHDWPTLRANWLYLVAMGALGYTVLNALFYLAAHRTGALNLSIIQGAIPALVLIGARVCLSVPFSGRQALGAAITMLGVAAIAAEGDPARLAALAVNSGDLIMVVGSVLYAGYTVGLRERPPVSGLSMLAAMALAAFVTSIPLMIWEIASGGFVWPTAVQDASYGTCATIRSVRRASPKSSRIISRKVGSTISPSSGGGRRAIRRSVGPRSMLIAQAPGSAENIRRAALKPGGREEPGESSRPAHRPYRAS